jgi:hypothetical protein
LENRGRQNAQIVHLKKEMTDAQRQKSIASRQKQAEQQKEEFLAAYEKLANNISVACKQVGISRSTFYSWMEHDSDFASSIRNLDEAMLDFAEYALMNQIKEGNTTAIIFYLKSKGKKRGYTEKLELGTGEDNRIRIEIVDASS